MPYNQSMKKLRDRQADGKSFPHLHKFDFVRVAAVTPVLHLADPAANAETLRDALAAASAGGADVAVCPELCLTGYTCGDLFHQEQLWAAAEDALQFLLENTAELPLIFAVGLPVVLADRLYNAAAICSSGQLLGVVPKTHLPRRNEFYEGRWFVSGREAPQDSIFLAGQQAPFGTDLLFAAGNPQQRWNFGVEICEDLWTVEPPSGRLALAGAHLILNLSASPEVLGKADYRRDLIRQQSARCLAAYVYASSAMDESSADLLYGGHALIAENGTLLAEGERFLPGGRHLLADIDIGFLQHERLRNSSFMEVPRPATFRSVAVPWPGATNKITKLLQVPEPDPFVPNDPARRAGHCREIFSIQASALARRLSFTRARRAVIGLSGGLDSTLAFLVCLEAMRRLDRSPQDILAVTMPGFGTTERTKTNASSLAELAGAELREIPIGDAVRLHLQQIGQPEGLFDVTFENAQARERTQLLMDLANREGGLVVGTGDMSEAALGWCTFNGDHMSMFHVNAGVPKTLVRYLVEWCADEVYTGNLAGVLRDVTATPISPELLPVNENGQSEQATEDVVGPYRLHDFFLFHLCRRGAPPDKILWLASLAYEEEFPPGEIARWLQEFLRRFFASQFKRNSQPDGPKVGSVALSPRGDWRMPSDASPQAWLSTDNFDAF